MADPRKKPTRRRTPARAREILREISRLCDLYDGRHTDVLEQAAAACAADPLAIPALLTIARKGTTSSRSVAATWLLLRLSKSDESLLSGHAGQLVELLVKADSGEARLHLLQILDRLNAPAAISASARRTLLASTLTLARDDNTFVRAWALGGLARLGGCMPAQRRRISGIIKRAEADEPASVRARLRQLRHQGVLDWTGTARDQ